jgi:hypothetical protein
MCLRAPPSDHLAPIRRRLDRQERHAQRREAHRLDDPRIVVSLGSEFAERLERLLVLFDARHQHGGVIARDAAKLRRVSDSEHSRLQQMLQRLVVVLDPEFTQTEEREPGAVLRRESHHFTEGIAVVGKSSGNSRQCLDTSSPT